MRNPITGTFWSSGLFVMHLTLQRFWQMKVVVFFPSFSFLCFTTPPLQSLPVITLPVPAKQRHTRQSRAWKTRRWNCHDSSQHICAHRASWHVHTRVFSWFLPWLMTLLWTRFNSWGVWHDRKMQLKKTKKINTFKKTQKVDILNLNLHRPTPVKFWWFLLLNCVPVLKAMVWPRNHFRPLRVKSGSESRSVVEVEWDGSGPHSCVCPGLWLPWLIVGGHKSCWNRPCIINYPLRVCLQINNCDV